MLITAYSFYLAMFAECGYAMIRRPSVSLSVCLYACDACVPWSYSFEFFENNYTKM